MGEEVVLHRPLALIQNRGCLYYMLKTVSSGLAVVFSRLMFAGDT